MHKQLLYISFLIVLFSCKNAEKSNLELNGLFGNHAVLQQDTTIEIWGWATNGTTININTTWGEATQTLANEKGKWKLKLNTPSAGETHEITVFTKDTSITISDILMGEVWLCGGQSNMNMPMEGFGSSMPVENAEAEMAAANYPEIRQFLVRNVKQIHEQERVKGEWKICTPENVKNFSAVGYYFGKAIHKKLNVPVGLIKSTNGGTPAEAWTSYDGLKSNRELELYAKDIADIRQSETLLSNWFQCLDADKTEFQNKEEVLQYSAEKGFEIANSEAPAHATTISLPAILDESGIPFLNYFNGIIWLIKEVDIPENWQSQKLMLTLGKIVDHDRVYFNGEMIGETKTGSLYKINREYIVDAALVKSGVNRIAIQLFDWDGEAGFQSGDNALKLFPVNHPEEGVALAGEWKVFLQAEIFDQIVYNYANETVYANRPNVKGSFQNRTSSGHFNGMIAPLIPYTFKGVVFYQGEANSRWKQGALLYHKIFPAMVADWRTKWDSEFPFYYVQIAPFEYGNEINSAYLRDVQRKSMKTIPNSGMVSILDVGNPDDIHPSFKNKVGERLALWALTNTYDKNVGEYSGPLPDNLRKKGNQLILRFSHAKNGLVLKETTQNEFEIAGVEEIFVPATVEVNGNELIASSPEIINPVQLRYAWRNAPKAALFNTEGLPASSFCTEKIEE